MNDIIIVSGLPRSGTSLMMSMLSAGGAAIFADHKRQSDLNNPNGYFEFEKVKSLKNDASWMPQVRGKTIKIISNLLIYLPENENYKIIFIKRNINEILASQASMLKRLGKPNVNNAKLKEMYLKHLAEIQTYLSDLRNINVLYVDHNDVIFKTKEVVRAISVFIGFNSINHNLMEQVVDVSLYREKSLRI